MHCAFGHSPPLCSTHTRNHLNDFSFFTPNSITSKGIHHSPLTKHLRQQPPLPDQLPPQPTLTLKDLLKNSHKFSSFPFPGSRRQSNGVVLTRRSRNARVSAMVVPVELSDRDSLLRSASISLNNKVVSQYATLLAPLAFDAVNNNDYTTKWKRDEEKHDDRQILVFIEGGAIPALVKHLQAPPLIDRVQKPLSFKHERRRRFEADRVGSQVPIKLMHLEELCQS